MEQITLIRHDNGLQLQLREQGSAAANQQKASCMWPRKRNCRLDYGQRKRRGGRQVSRDLVHIQGPGQRPETWSHPGTWSHVRGTGPRPGIYSTSGDLVTSRDLVPRPGIWSKSGDLVTSGDLVHIQRPGHIQGPGPTSRDLVTSGDLVHVQGPGLTPESRLWFVSENMLSKHFSDAFGINMFPTCVQIRQKPDMSSICY